MVLSILEHYLLISIYVDIFYIIESKITSCLIHFSYSRYPPKLNSNARLPPKMAVWPKSHIISPICNLFLAISYQY